MKSRVFLSLLLINMICGCSLPRYVPYSSDLGISTHGSFITLNLKSGARIKGELIVADSTKLLILDNKENETASVVSDIPISSINHFRLQFARPRNYGLALIPGIVLPLIPFPDPDDSENLMIFHGVYAILTIPANLVAISAIYGWSMADFSYNNLTVSYFDLHKFARYPQGLPPGTEITAIR